MGDFVSSRVAKKLKLETTDVTNQTLSFANGERAFCNKEAKTYLRIGNYQEDLSLKVAPLPHHDIILGKPWLERWNPTVDWRKNTIDISMNGKTYLLQPPTPETHRSKTQHLSAIQVRRSIKRKDQWFLAFVNEVSIDKTAEPEHPILKEFADVFPDHLPKELPPKRSVDHRIELSDDKPPQIQLIYRMSPKELEALRKELDELI